MVNVPILLILITTMIGVIVGLLFGTSSSLSRLALAAERIAIALERIQRGDGL